MSEPAWKRYGPNLRGRQAFLVGLGNNQRPVTILTHVRDNAWMVESRRMIRDVHGWLRRERLIVDRDSLVLR